jgi:hypothetical protein
VARSGGSGRVRYRLQYRHTVRTRISTIITIGISLTGLRGTQLVNSIRYTLVNNATEYRNIIGGLQYLAYTRLIFLMQLIMSASFFRHHVTLIGLLSSAFCAIFGLLLLVDCIFVLHRLVRSLHSLMQTGLAVQMIGDPWGDMLSTLVLT